MALLQLDEVQLHYELRGQADNPVLVLSNSLGTNLTMWAPQLPELAQHFQLLRYDGRGHGKSSVPPGPYCMDQLGSDVVALLDHLNIDRASFCGISMGGMVGQWLGVHAANRIHKLVLANTAAKIGTLEGWNERIETVRAHGLESVIPATLERWFTPAFRMHSPEIIEQTRQMLTSMNVEGYIASCAAVRDMDSRKVVSKIHASVLVISGTYDNITPLADGHFLAEHIPGAQFTELKAAHLSCVEAASDFNSAVSQFLQT
ncbi:MAG: 3-oxoadipate enol-lactonase [Acidobacteriaceae bacterium]